MNKILRHKFLFFLLLAIPFAAISADVLDTIAGAIKTGNSKEISKYLDNNVEITILDKEAVYSKAQAELVIKDFFDKNPVKGFELLHRGSSGEGATYGIGTMNTASQSFRVYYFVKQKGGYPVIQELRFEKQK